jgi:xanthine dehydrogenase accessory factor
MPESSATLDKFLTANSVCVLVTIVSTEGSTPREEGAFILVSQIAQFGTIGGGQLEYSAIDTARQMLASAQDFASMEIPLGPAIGQCCGGRVRLDLERVTEELRARLLQRESLRQNQRPTVYLFGAGHVGNALAQAFTLLPVKTVLVDQREAELNSAPAGVEKVHAALPEELVARAPKGSAFLVLTHDHALDFLIVQAALARPDAAYVGMIGSKSKRANFKSWYLRQGGKSDVLSKLVSPIGSRKVKDKRPSVIAAFAAVEVMTALLSAGASVSQPEPAHV